MRGRGRHLLWQGPSTIDGRQVRVLLTSTELGEVGKNTKLGDMSQAWILPVDESPNEAVRSGADVSVCGTCRQRPLAGGACYVFISRGPQRVDFGHRRNPYLPPETLAAVAQKPMRIGAWGDPAAVPVEAWQPLLEALRASGKGWTAYTHRWRELDVRDWGWCMASVDSVGEAEDADAAGWKHFRVRKPGEPLLPREVRCLAAAESPGHAKWSCASCLMCDGSARGLNIAILSHGIRRGRFREEQLPLPYLRGRRAEAVEVTNEEDEAQEEPLPHVGEEGLDAPLPGAGEEAAGPAAEAR